MKHQDKLACIADEGEHEEMRRMRRIAFSSVVVSTVAIVACVIALPMLYSYTQGLQSALLAETDYCRSRSRDLMMQMSDIQSQSDVHLRQRRQWTFNNANSGYGSQPGGFGPNPVIAGSQQFVQGGVSSGGCCTCFRGPAGEPGDDGEPGDAGDDGLAGEDGQKGKDGQVIKNSNEPPCMQCPLGPRGPFGPQGDQGPKGPKGSPGATGTDGTAGEPGMVGPQGFPGRPGRPGPLGEVGAPGVQIPEDSPEGPEGPVGPPGPKGAPGIPGNDGLSFEGPPGEPGNAGDQGAAGKEGEKGPKGFSGPKGLQGDCNHCPPPRLPPGF